MQESKECSQLAYKDRQMGGYILREFEDGVRQGVLPSGDTFLLPTHQVAVDSDNRFREGLKRLADLRERRDHSRFSKDFGMI